MVIMTWILMIFLFTYTIGFSVALWKDHNKIGSLAVSSLVVITFVSAFFGILK
ncbi:hypothetical protein [Bacillus sp. S/N-304-OC-R1]|uniref:hypothetical protein n=1 Tax=Bacillus sp. S/N-304-OC-R1 TaxID=2758034 RepID=UPI001C8D9B79|nr:hypothetical protein [Bacillus sp. S/N-304-OC-R1]MBY0121704.1 hypothetical protein [Bacillus sp. S/N-304-OC-R1]